MGKLVQEMMQAMQADPKVDLYDAMRTEVGDLNRKLTDVNAGFFFVLQMPERGRTFAVELHHHHSTMKKELVYIVPDAVGRFALHLTALRFRVNADAGLEDALLFLKDALLDAIDIPTKARLRQRESGWTSGSSFHPGAL